MLKRWKRVWLPLALVAVLSLATGAVAVAGGADKGAGEDGDSAKGDYVKSDYAKKASEKPKGFTLEDMAAWPAEKKAEWNAGVAEKAAWLEENCGVPVATEEVAPGVDGIVWTAELKDALADMKTTG
ncbi:MAG: hypothetical protein KKA32_14595 [Actinobacteria bacterium]|nr:hypothetical protein [Actinomycetota bacterium]